MFNVGQEISIPFYTCIERRGQQNVIPFPSQFPVPTAPPPRSLSDDDLEKMIGLSFQLGTV